MVNAQRRCWTLMILKDIEVVLSMEYMSPEVGLTVNDSGKEDI